MYYRYTVARHKRWAIINAAERSPLNIVEASARARACFGAITQPSCDQQFTRGWRGCRHHQRSSPVGTSWDAKKQVGDIERLPLVSPRCDAKAFFSRGATCLTMAVVLIAGLTSDVGGQAMDLQG